MTSSELMVKQHHGGSGENRAEDETPFSSPACLHTIIAHKCTEDKDGKFANLKAFNELQGYEMSPELFACAARK